MHCTTPARTRPTSPTGSACRRTAAAALGAALLVGLPTAADAHVRVIPDSTEAGSWTAMTFRVPNESADAQTVEVSVELPTDTPLLSVSTRPVPGWTATVERAALPEPLDLHGSTVTEAPVRVTWRADAGAGIGDGEFEEFRISAGPLPDEPGTRIVLPAAQTYSDGTVVRWDEVADGDEEPAHPAPQLVLTAPPEGDEAEDTAADTASADGVARALGGAGLGLGMVAVALALTGRRSRAGKE